MCHKPPRQQEGSDDGWEPEPRDDPRPDHEAVECLSHLTSPCRDISNLVEWHGLTVIKPNRAKAFLASGIPNGDPDIVPSQYTDLKRTGETLLKRWEAENVLITLGEHGMMLFQKKEAPHYIPTKAREVFDVSGAGDTAIALFTLGLACGATPTEAAEIANHASAVVVSKLGTATVTRDELMARFREDSEGG